MKSQFLGKNQNNFVSGIAEDAVLAENDERCIYSQFCKH